MATNYNTVVCENKDCRRTNRLQVQREYRLKMKEESKTKKRSKKSITDIAVEARKAGMTYGQYVAKMGI